MQIKESDFSFISLFCHSDSEAAGPLGSGLRGFLTSSIQACFKSTLTLAFLTANYVSAMAAIWEK